MEDARTCPSCGSPLVREEGEAAYRRISIDRPAQALERLRHWGKAAALWISKAWARRSSRASSKAAALPMWPITTASTKSSSLLDMGRVNKDGEPIRLGSTVAAKLVAAIEASKSRSFAVRCSVWRAARRQDHRRVHRGGISLDRCT